jgi:hypothetical protein
VLFQKASVDVRRKRTQQRPGLESLEGRQLMSLGPELQVNLLKVNDQFESATAGALAGGMSVTVWTNQFKPGDRDIEAQVFRPDGSPFGSETSLVGDNKDQHEPAVAMDKFGNIILAWTEEGPNGDSNVFARKFTPTGLPLTNIVPVGVTIFREHDPSIAVDFNGDFVVSYTRDTNGNNPDVYAKLYDTNGQLRNVLSVGVQASRAETHSSVAMSPLSGAIDVAYQLAFSPTDDDIVMARFTDTGAPLGNSFIATSFAREQAPSLSMDLFGNAVVAYQKQNGTDFNIKARRINSSGSVGPELNIASSTGIEVAPSVALQGAGGRFVVALEDFVLINGTFHRFLVVTEVSPSNTVLNAFNAGIDRAQASVAFVGFSYSDYQVSYTNLIGNNFDPGLGIRRRRGSI